MNAIAVGAVFAGLGVVLGAFGAHGLKDILTDYSREVYDKGSLYHFIHSIALIINGILQKSFMDFNFK